MLWVLVSAGAASMQVVRNTLQRGLMGGAGPWGATLVRFLFGLPISLALASLGLTLEPHARLALGPRFLAACAVGGAAQIAATAAMLVSMRRSSFALGTVFQLSGIPLAALIGLLFGDELSPLRWIGLGLTAGALAVLGWPRRAHGHWTAGPLGLFAGLCFALAANADRQAALTLSPGTPFAAAQVTLVVVQAMQSAVLGLWLALADRAALAATFRSWRASLGAGVFGAGGSALWFWAFALAPAGPVRAVGAIEAPLAALAGRRVFAERPRLWQWLTGAVSLVGVALAALG